VQLNTSILLLLLLLLFRTLFVLRIVVQGHQTILYALLINTHDLQQILYAFRTTTQAIASRFIALEKGVQPQEIPCEILIV
jgi:hypothetical protein